MLLSPYKIWSSCAESNREPSAYKKPVSTYVSACHTLSEPENIGLIKISSRSRSVQAGAFSVRIDLESQYGLIKLQ